MVVRHVSAPQYIGEEVHCVCKRFFPHTQSTRAAAELRAKVSVIVKKMLQWYLTTLCNLYSGLPKFSYDSGSNDSAIFSYLSVSSCFVQLFPLPLAVFTVPFHNQQTLPALPTALCAGCFPENMALSKEQHVAWVRAEGLVLLADSTEVLPTHPRGISW